MRLMPCDCKDQNTCDKLNEQGIGINDNQLLVENGKVFIKNSTTSMMIPMLVFKKFAKWYLEEQEIIKKI